MRLILKILVGILVVVAMFTTAYLIIKMAEFQAQQLLMTSIQRHLSTLRDNQTAQIEHYFHTLSHQLQLYAHTQSVIEAMRGFKKTFPQFQAEALTSPTADSVPESYQHALAYFYINDFAKEYQIFNGHQGLDLPSSLNRLDDNSIALQFHYLAANPNPIGLKEELLYATDASSYTRWHRDYHTYLKYFQTYSGVEDIFLIDSDTGMIVYSVTKQIDFATSLKTGPYANTPLGKVFEQAQLATHAHPVVLVDFSPYLPSYNQAMAFMGTPIVDGQQNIGVLIFRVGIDGLNALMTYNQAWSLEQLGRMGETYLVAADGTMRNDSRLLVEDKEVYLSIVKQRGELPAQTISQIEWQNTTVKLQKIDTIGTESALAGMTDVAIYEEYHDEFVISAYAPVNILGLQWAVFATFSEAEALAPWRQFMTTLTSGSIQIVIGILLIGLISLILAWPSAGFLATSTPQPKSKITQFSKTYTLDQIIEHLNKLK